MLFSFRFGLVRSGDAGDIMVRINSEGETKTFTLVDFDGGVDAQMIDLLSRLLAEMQTIRDHMENVNLQLSLMTDVHIAAGDIRDA